MISKTSLFKIILVFTLILSALSVFLFYDKAISYVKQTMAYYYIFKGDQHYQKGDYQKAIDDYNYALQLYPEHTKAQYNLGNIYAVYEDFYSAINCYEKTINIKPNYIKARINLGNILTRELRDIDRAIYEYSQATQAKVFPLKIPFIFNDANTIRINKAIAYYNLGVAYKTKSLLYGYDTINARDYLLSAAKSYKQSLNLDPNNYNTHYNLAITLHLLKNYNEAIKEYCKAIKLAPVEYDSSGAHYNLAILLRQMGRYKEALVELKKAGLILGAKGNEERVYYIFQILNDTTQRALNQTNVKNDCSSKPGITNNKVTSKRLEKLGESLTSCDVCANIQIQ